jgi:CelD/BcsL family acetyltransferase involved in cellulose biosynthesis
VRVELVDDFGLIRADWTRLAAASNNVFSTWEWNSVWWRHFGAGRRLLVSVCRDETEVVAIVPLYRWRDRPLRVLRFVGHGHGDLLGPVCDQRDRELTARALRAALASVRFDVFLGDWLLADGRYASVLGGRIVRETGYPILGFGVASWDEFLRTRSKGFRKDQRRDLRGLEERYAVRFRMTAEPAELERDLDAVFDLHRARFGKHDGCYFCGANEAFQRAFAACALERGWLRLWLLELDGRPVAAEYGFRFGDAWFAYQTGRDPAVERASVGTILGTYTVRQALEEGVTEYRFLQGNEPYKYSWANLDPELEAIGIPGSVVGRIAISGLVPLRGVRPVAALAKRLAR